MSILLADNMSYQGRKPLDNRLLFDTIANMAATAESSLYEGIISYNLEDNKFYTYKSTNTADATYGKWEEFNLGSDEVMSAATTYTQDTAYAKDTFIILEQTLCLAYENFTSDSIETDVTDSFAADIKAGHIYPLVPFDQLMPPAPADYDYDIETAGNGYAINEIIETTLSGLSVKITQVGSDGDILQVTATTSNISATNGSGATITPTKKLYVANGQEWTVLPEVEANGTSALTKDITSNVTVGGADAGTFFSQGLSLTDAFEKILRKAIIPTATFETTNAGLHEQGTTVPNSTLKITITNLPQVTAEIKKIIFKVNGVELSNIDFVPGTSTYTADYTTSMSADTTFTGSIIYDDDQVLNYTNKILFVYPTYFGSVDSLTPTQASITALTKIIKDKKAYSAENVSLTDARFCYAYPSSFGNLASIKDANNFEYLNSYTKTSISIDSINYNVYILTDPVTITGAKQIYA